MTRVASLAEAIVFCWSGRSMRRPIIPPTFVGLAALSAPDEPTLTAMTMSAPIASDRLHRQVLRLAAVDEHVAVDLDRREARGDGHARPDDAGEVPARHDVGLARLDVGRDGAERDAQLVEVRDRGARQRRALEHEAELAAGDQARRQQEPALLEVQAELERDQVLEVVFLLPEGLVLAFGSVPEERVPGNRADELFHLVGRVAARVEAADDRAHARAGDVVDRDVKLLEHPDDADVRRAARAAAAERETDLRARLVAVKPAGRRPEPRKAALRPSGKTVRPPEENESGGFS